MINNLPLKTNLKRRFKDSGTFVKRNDSTIPSGSIFAFELEKRFQPYDDVVAVNLNSDNDCTVFVNGSSIEQPLPKGNKVTIGHTAVRDLTIKNNGDTSISANEIEIYYRHTTNEGMKDLNTASNLSSVAFAVKSIFGK